MFSARIQIVFLKYSFALLNVLIVLSGCAVLVASALFIAQYSNYNSYANHHFSNAIVGTLVVSTCLIAIGIFGCYTATQESHRCLMWFTILLVGISLAEFVSGSVLLNDVHKVSK